MSPDRRREHPSPADSSKTCPISGQECDFFNGKDEGVETHTGAVNAVRMVALRECVAVGRDCGLAEFQRSSPGATHYPHHNRRHRWDVGT